MGSRNVFPSQVANDVDEILKELQSRSDFNAKVDKTLPADGELKVQVQGIGQGYIKGQAKSTGQYTINVEWLDSSGNVQRTEGITSNISGGDWSNFKIEAKTAMVNIVIEDKSSSQQTAELMVHFTN